MSGVSLGGSGRGLVLFENTLGQSLDVGDTVFAGSLEIHRGGIGRTSIDATDASFNGVLASSLSIAQAFAVVDKIVDAVDLGRPGWRCAHLIRAVFVTPNSFASPATTAADIQRAVNVASNANVIHIQTGTYSGNVDTVVGGLNLTLSPGARRRQCFPHG